MGLAERLAAHQNKEEEDDRPLTEDEELAKRMAERSWAERQEEPEGLKRIKRMGKQMAPDRTSAHLAMRFGARAALLEAFRDARKQQIAKGKATPMTGTSTVATMEATMSDHQKAQIWRFFNSQTQMGLEIPFWLALDCLMQRELCGRACLGRAPLDREAWVVGKKQEKMYVVVKGSACVVEASEGGGTPSGTTMANEEEVTDKAMVEGPIWRRDPANDLRKASHVFGCLKVPDAVQECLTKACSDARKLRSFLLREIDRSIEFDELLVKEGFEPEIGLTRTPREGDATFLTTEEPAQEEEEPPQEESSEDEDSDDPDVIKRRDEENLDEDALSDVDHAEASRVMKSLDVMAQNQRLAIVEIEAALPGFPDKLFGNFLLEQFKSLDVNSDGEIELKELAECCRRWRKIRRDKERSLERKEAKRLRREARWKQALEEQVKPEYRFGLDAAEDEPDEDNSWQDWTWDKPLGAKFSAGAEYLSFRTGRSWDRLWKDAQEPAVAPGPVGRLTPSEVLALRARGLGFLAPHAQIRELDCNDLLVDESTKPSEVFLTLEGTVAIEMRRELDEDDDAGVHAAVEKGLFRDTVTLAVLPAPVLVGEFASIDGFGKKQYCKVTALGDLPVHAGVNDDDAKLDAAEKDVDPGTGKRRIRKGTRVLAISAKLFEKLLAQRPEEKRALEKAALIKRAWLDERKKHRCEVRRRRNRARKKRLSMGEDDSTVVTGGLSHAAPEFTGSRYWKLWSCGAVLAKGAEDLPWKAEALRTDDNNPLCVPPSFYSGAVLDFDEAQLAMDLVVDPPDDADVEDAAARARKIRMEVSLADTGALGSFSLPGLFDELEEDGGVKSPLQHWKEVLPRVEIFPFFCFLRDLRGVATRAVWSHGLDVRRLSSAPAARLYAAADATRTHAASTVLPEEREALLPPDEHDYVMRQEKVRPPSITQLKAVAKTPFLMPYPSMTLNRTLLGVNLPECSKLELPAKQCDDSKPPVLDPQARRDLAAVGLARRRAKLGRNKMRDPRDETKRNKMLLGGFPGNYKPKQQEVEAAFKFKPKEPKAGVVMAGNGYKAAKEMVRDDDRRPIHSNLGDALHSLVGVRGAQISDMSETFARTRREEAAALREARLDGTYREPWDIEPGLLRSTQEVLADGLKSFEKTSTEKWPTVRELSPRRAAAKVGEMTAPYEYGAAPPPDRSSTPGPMFRFQAEAPTVSRKSVRGSLRTTPTPSLSS